ncbi:MAG: DUF2889 domain-containing protein [Acetobacteraceae bacterium]|nr:DUF2889 domain-containing protein [Acetobacteraceae bacterium]
MPLSSPAPRRRLHTRAIELCGYEREDGLFEVEASLTDTKTYVFTNEDRGEITPGVPLHGMLSRMTYDSAMLIHAFEAATEFGPYFACPAAAENFGDLAGLTIGRGFLRAANERIGGIKGCTHLRELLGQMGTVALQTVVRQRMQAASAAGNRPAQLNTCMAYADGGLIARRTWPEYYAQRDAAESEASSA